MLIVNLQENMELIDKLEKLSAEKASSAESIEIVEGLTQQEKLELAAYQKHLNPEGRVSHNNNKILILNCIADATTESLKCGDEDNIEPAAELNESVLQLSEDTAELLQKIDIFTQERKEVMQKMECLKEENDALHIKVKIHLLKLYFLYKTSTTCFPCTRCPIIVMVFVHLLLQMV